MIQVRICLDAAKSAAGIEIEGHAGYDEYGKDIICAAVSSLALNMANSVEAFTDDPFEADVDEESGRFTFRFTGPVSRESKLLMDSLVLGLTNTEQAYGQKYIRIRFEEV